MTGNGWCDYDLEPEKPAEEQLDLWNGAEQESTSGNADPSGGSPSAGSAEDSDTPPGETSE